MLRKCSKVPIEHANVKSVQNKFFIIFNNFVELLSFLVTYFLIFFYMLKAPFSVTFTLDFRETTGLSPRLVLFGEPFE